MVHAEASGDAQGVDVDGAVRHVLEYLVQTVNTLTDAFQLILLFFVLAHAKNSATFSRIEVVRVSYSFLTQPFIAL